MRRKDEEIVPTGASYYRDSYPGLREDQPRIYVKFSPAGTGSAFWALLDTGAHFCLLNETVASLIRDQLTESLGTFSVRTAHGPIRGDLYLHRIKLIAEVGESLDIDATVFVPPGWQGPCFLGYVGVLERIFFAVHPGTNQFRFSALRATGDAPSRIGQTRHSRRVRAEMQA